MTNQLKTSEQNKPNNSKSTERGEGGGWGRIWLCTRYRLEYGGYCFYYPITSSAGLVTLTRQADKGEDDTQVY